VSEISLRGPLHGGDPSVLRRLNSAATLRALRGGGEPTLSELAKQVGLSRPTCEGVLAELTERGLVSEVAPRSGAGLGRPARRYRFRAEAGYALGIEIDAHWTQLFLADLSGEVVARHRVDLDVGWEPAARLSAVRSAVRTCLAEAEVERSSLWAVGAGTPGVIDPDGTVALCTVVPGWHGLNLARELGRSFSCKVHVENDANLAAMAERWRGVARDVDDVVAVQAGLHTGAGVIVGGRLHRGRWGAAGEVGMLPELGWIDTTARLIGGGRPALGSGRAAERVLVAAGEGDPDAVEMVDRLAEGMSKGVAAMVLALDPEMVVVGGALAGERLVAELSRHVRPLCFSPTRIEMSSLGDAAVGLGAVRLALDRIDERLFHVE